MSRSAPTSQGSPTRSKACDAPVFLGVEGGGTRTRVVVADASGRVLRALELGPANARLLADLPLRRLLRAIRSQTPEPAAVGIGLAGARTDADRARIHIEASRVWPGVPCVVTHDLEIALRAAADWNLDEPGRGTRSASRGRSSRRPGKTAARVMILSGTGSCCFGRTPDGCTVKLGGWGHVLGDKGSGYEIGLRGLKAAVYYLDRDGRWSALGRMLLRTLQLNRPDDLIDWARDAGKTEIAALAPVVFAARERGDRIARDILKGAAATLAKDGLACARRLVPQNGEVEFILAGGVLVSRPSFGRQVGNLLRSAWRRSRVTVLRRDGAWGAAAMARDSIRDRLADISRAPGARSNRKPHGICRGDPQGTGRASMDPGDLARSPTEQRHPDSMRLDRMSTQAIVELMLREEERVRAGLLAVRRKIARAVGLVVAAFRSGGRLLYAGAGTSGRLGVLDASECPPTFRTDPDLVQGVIAGGRRALWEAVEGAEDDAGGGAEAMRFRGVCRKDIVVGIAASGRTPFVRGALEEAGRRGAATVLISFNPRLRLAKEDRPGLVICPGIGPEILTGSTRLKAGTATKLILNMLTTVAMVRMGKVRGNLMIDVKATNTKLRDRAARMVMELTGADRGAADAALRRAGWRVGKACEALAGRRVRPGTSRPSRSK